MKTRPGDEADAIDNNTSKYTPKGFASMPTGSDHILSFSPAGRNVHRSPTILINGKPYVIEYADRNAARPKDPGAIVAREEDGSGEFRLVPTTG
jgi:hypothetical protein